MGFGIGETVGPYQITRYLGQGGMATIYRAHQTTLDRDVALKVIHPALKEDPSFLARLSREAAIVAKLNHPNIVTVYDFGEFEGMPFLVMRFIEGKTLKALLQEDRLATEQILAIARSIAHALIYAHAHGVLHRDVKPSNVLIDHEGNVYLTDFGLARLAHSSDSTMSRDMLIGSPQYISPEQAKSEAVDERSDIYSFGIILFEMFTGQVPFQGETAYATVMAQINDPPPSPRALNPNIPPAVEKVVQKSLAKNREERYSSVSEMLTALENAIRGPQETEDADAVPIVLNAFPHPPTPAAPVSRPTQPAISSKSRLAAPSLTGQPDKRLILIGAGLLAVCMLGVCGLLLGTFGARFPSIAANWVLPTGSPLARISPASTPTRSLSPTPDLILVSTPTASRPPSPSGGAEAPRGKIAYSVATGELPEEHSIWIANANGTEAHPILEIAMWPALSPDGRQIAYYRMKDSGIYVANVDGSNNRKVLGFANTCCAQWSPDSKRLAYFQGDIKKFGGSIYVVNADGTNPVQIATGFNPSWAPDGSRLVYTSCQPNTFQCGIFTVDLQTKTQTLLTRDNGANPQWSPRGDKIVYQADDGKGHINIFLVNPDGTGLKQITSGRSNDGQPAWSRDGNYIFWRSDQNGAGWALFSMRADGSNPRRLINNIPATVMWGRESLSTSP